jgi:flagellar basal-body rod protein FlgF
MIYGLYLSAQGAEAQTRRLDVLANNLANASTNAFKRDLAIFQAHRPYDAEQGLTNTLREDDLYATGGISLADVATDFSDGSLLETGGRYDLALTGFGFFRVSDGEQELLTRNGQFTTNERGELVTHDRGLAVQGIDGGPIVVPPEARDIEIMADGRIIEQDETGVRAEIGRIAVVRPESPHALQKVGNSFYRAGGDLAEAGGDVRVRQGYLESSGTRSIMEMLDLIGASRGFEANVNMIQTQDEALSRLLQTMGRR